MFKKFVGFNGIGAIFGQSEFRRPNAVFRADFVDVVGNKFDVIVDFGNFCLRVLGVQSRFHQIAVNHRGADQKLDIALQGNYFQAKPKLDFAEPIFFPEIWTAFDAGQAGKNLFNRDQALLIILGNVNGQQGLFNAFNVLFSLPYQPDVKDKDQQADNKNKPPAVAENIPD